MPAAASGPVLRAWRAFLGRRYPNPAALNAAHGLVGDRRLEAFEEASFPVEVPPDGAPLLDWFEFSSIVLPIRPQRAALKDDLCAHLELQRAGNSLG